jgi:ABC-type transporter Mla subunit MlaD
MADDTQKILDALTRIEARTESIEETLNNLSGEIGELKAESKNQSDILGKTNAAVMEVAGLQQEHGGRLNTIDSRLARIEKHTGLVKA